MKKIIDDLQPPCAQNRKTESHERNVTPIDVGVEIKNLVANLMAVGGGPSRQPHSLHPPYPFAAISTADPMSLNSEHRNNFHSHGSNIIILYSDGAAPSAKHTNNNWRVFNGNKYRHRNLHMSFLF